MTFRCTRLLSALVIASLGVPWSRAAEPTKTFEQDNLIAWCIVPFDAKKRSPEDRAAMLERLGFKKYAYDWRAEHLPTFEREVVALKKHHVDLTAVWFPANLGPDAKALLAVIEKHKLTPQLWVSMGNPAGSTQEEKVASAAKTLRPIAEEAARLGCKVAMYNHGAWYGEPENQLEILKLLKLPNVGIVYNLHHGHDHLDRFPKLLDAMKPHLLALNLNGMVASGDKVGKKILPLGQGDLDLGLLGTIAASGYSGPIGILGHTSYDAEERLRDNLDGLNWLRPQLSGMPGGTKPQPRTLSQAAPPTSKMATGWLAEGKPAYRKLPLTLEVAATVRSKSRFNILAASDPKSSGDHWELFTWPQTGGLTAYLPGRQPDHIRSSVNVCDGKPHQLAMILEANVVRLYVDGKEVARSQTKSNGKPAVTGGIGFGRLVEGGLGCDGDLARVRLSKTALIPQNGDLDITEDTLGLWTFPDLDKPAPDLSKDKNDAKPSAADASMKGVAPTPGPNLVPTDTKLSATLIDRSSDDAYMAVKVDGAGHVFVGGREKVFVF